MLSMQFPVKLAALHEGESLSSSEHAARDVVMHNAVSMRKSDFFIQVLLLPAIVICNFIRSMDGGGVVSFKWPAHFVVSACFVGHIGLDIDAVDGFAFVEEVASGIAVIINPFGVTDLALFAGFRFAAKRVAVGEFIDLHTCGTFGT